MSELQGIYAHLNELRSRILKIVIAIGIITTFILTFRAEPILINDMVLFYPVPDPLHNIAAQITIHMKETLVPVEVEMIQTAPGQAFFAQIYIAALAGIVVSMPIIVREMTAFLKPALSDVEINAVRSIAVPALVLFVAGIVFSYLVVIPFMLNFLYQYGLSADLITFLNIVDFVGFVLQFLLAFGVAFQLPLIMYASTVSGLTDVQFWRRNIRYAIVSLVIIGAAVTPDGSGITMWFIAGPMIGLYLVGMFVLERREHKIQRLKSEYEPTRN